MSEDLKNKIKAIEIQQNELAAQKGELLDQLAKMECPFKLGDIGVLNGYSYRGKKAKIVKIYLKYDNWRVCLQVFKANGELGSIFCEVGCEDHFIVTN